MVKKLWIEFNVRRRGNPATLRFMPALIRHVGIAILLLSSPLLNGCTDFKYGTKDVTAGDEVATEGKSSFYVSNLAFGYITVPEKAYPLMLQDPVWSLPEGMTLVGDPQLSLAPKTISWSLGNATYSAKGLELKVHLNVKVSSNAMKGLSTILVGLPNIETVSALLGGRANSTASTKLPELIKVDSLMVHESAAGKRTALTFKFGIVASVAIVLILVIKRSG